MAELTVQQIDRDGTTPSFSNAAGGGDTFDNDGKTYLHVKNGGAGSITVTINSQKQCDQGFDHDLTVNINAGAEALIGPFPPDRFNDDNGEVNVSYSGTTSVTVAAFRL